MTDVQSKVIELQQAILAAQSSAMAANAAQYAAADELRAAREELEKARTERERYQLFKAEQGATVYVLLKSHRREGEPAHYLCACCLRSMLVRTGSAETGRCRGGVEGTTRTAQAANVLN